MLEENLDIVNESDEVVGSASHCQAHRLNLKHRSSHLLVIHTCNSHVFLQRRHGNKSQFPNCWDMSVSGHVKQGETYQRCIQRECQEEIGLAANKSLRYLDKITACADTGNEFIAIFCMIADGPIHLNATEISEGAWFTPSMVNFCLQHQPSMFAGAFSLVWQSVQRHIFF